MAGLGGQQGGGKARDQEQAGQRGQQRQALRPTRRGGGRELCGGRAPDPRPTRKHLTSETEPAGCSARGWVAAQELRRRAGAGEGDHGSEGAGAGVAAKARAHGRGQPEAEGLDPPRG